MIELNDCGRNILLTFDNYGTEVGVQMAIKAPRGTMALFGHQPSIYDGYTFSFPRQTQQCEAIRAFMEEHQEVNDGSQRHSDG